MITIIHGPNRTGKTHLATDFARHFRATFIVDGWDAEKHAFPDDGMLALTNSHPDAIFAAIPRGQNPPRVRIVDITTARLAIGAAPHAPGIAERLAR